jgi:ubiquinone/menaquinone biosynthesis C-methylase UbiE
MKNTIENNLKIWNCEYDWPKDGDEWDGQARIGSHSYEDWKQSVIETFIVPRITNESTVLEIAPGHGRWSNEIVHRCRQLYLVDLSPESIEFCKRRFEQYCHLQYIVNDGKTLPGVPDGGIDFVWSYDSFVHMEPHVIHSYLTETRRVLRSGRQAVIHHAGRRHGVLWLSFLGDMGGVGAKAYQILSMGEWKGSDGWRSNVSGKLVKQLAEKSGLTVTQQVQSWGKNNDYGVTRYGDYISILSKP